MTADWKDLPKFFRSCEPPFSFFEFTEWAVASSDTSRPFHRVCEVMRKGKAKTVFVDCLIAEQPDFEDKYLHSRKGATQLHPSANLLEMKEIAFFDVAIPDDADALPASITEGNVMATCMLATYRLDAPQDDFEAGEEVSFLWEAVVRFPTLPVSLEDHGGEGGDEGESEHEVYGAEGVKWIRNEMLNNYYHVRGDIEVVIDGRSFDIPAAYFTQRCFVDGSGCAQACLRMSLLHYSEDKEIEPLSSADISSIVLRERRRRGELSLAPLSKGLYVQDLEAVLKDQGAAMWFLDSMKTATPLYEFAYSLVESGIPALIGFHPAQDDKVLHLMPVVGHTINSDEWLPMAQSFYGTFDAELNPGGYISSSRWATHLIVNDDMLGPYLCLRSRDLLRFSDEQGVRKTASCNAADDKQHQPSLQSRIRYVIGIVREEWEDALRPYHAENVGASYFWSHWERMRDNLSEPWRKRFLANPFKECRLVLRTQLMESEEYVDHLQKHSDHASVETELTPELERQIVEGLPDLFWMVEFSLPEVFSSNRTKFGEVLVKFAPSRQEQDVFFDNGTNTLCLAFRFMNVFEVGEMPSMNLGFISHYPLHRRHDNVLEY